MYNSRRLDKFLCIDFFSCMLRALWSLGALAALLAALSVRGGLSNSDAAAPALLQMTRIWEIGKFVGNFARLKVRESLPASWVSAVVNAPVHRRSLGWLVVGER